LRAVYEFDLPTFTETIVSVTFLASVDRNFSAPGELSFFGFAGNGTIEPADAMHALRRARLSPLCRKKRFLNATAAELTASNPTCRRTACAEARDPPSIPSKNQTCQQHPDCRTPYRSEPNARDT